MGSRFVFTGTSLTGRPIGNIEQRNAQGQWEVVESGRDAIDLFREALSPEQLDRLNRPAQPTPPNPPTRHQRKSTPNPIFFK